jgi:hypothetical protein
MKEDAPIINIEPEIPNNGTSETKTEENTNTEKESVS